MSFPDAGVYDPRRESGGLDAEALRLERQAALSWPEEFAILARLTAAPAPSILEVGCGSGAVTECLLRAWPDATVTALEPDSDLLDMARRRLAGTVPERVQWVHGSIEENDLPDRTFDLIVIRYVLQHLKDATGAVRSLLPKLADGGRLAAIDVDGALWGAAHPTDPSLAELHAAASAWQGRAGGDKLIGRRLWSILHDAGVAAPMLEVFAYHSGERGLAAFEPQLNPERLLPAVGSGDLPFDSYLRLIEAHRGFNADPTAFVLMLGFIAHGGRAG